MKENDLVSFIIPIFNNSINQLNNCLSSIKKVKVAKEIIVIDDGSSKELSNKYKKISKKWNAKYFYKKNGGVSSARNYGINMSAGSFITFVDCDDELQIKEINIKNILQYDVIFYSVEVYFIDKNVLTKYSLKNKREELSRQFLLKKSLKDGLMNWSVAKLYSRKFLERKNIKFDINRISGEDWKFVNDVVRANPKLLYIPDIFYLYKLDRDTSKNRVLSNPKISFENTAQLYSDRLKIVKESNIKNKKDLYIYLTTYLVNYIFSTYMTLVLNSKERINIYCSYSLHLINTLAQKEYLTTVNKFKIFLINSKSYYLIWIYNKLSLGYKRIKRKVN